MGSFITTSCNKYIIYREIIWIFYTGIHRIKYNRTFAPAGFAQWLDRRPTD